MSKVYVCHEPFIRNDDGSMQSKFNLSPASEYGDIEILIPAGMSLISSVPTVRIIRDKLRHFSDDDYLLPTGDPAIMMIAGAIAAEFNGGRVKVLRWDKQERRYLPIQVDTSGKTI